MKPIVLTSLLIAALPIATQPLSGATITVATDGGAWGNSATWSSGALPTVSDTAIINANRTVNVNSVVATPAGQITVSNQTGGLGTGTLNVNNGGDLTYEGVLFISSAGDLGTVNVLSGGALPQLTRESLATCSTVRRVAFSTFWEVFLPLRGTAL